MFLGLIISYPSVYCQYISITVQRHLILFNAQNPACKSHNRLVTIKETTPNSGPFPFLHPAAGGGATTGPGVGPRSKRLEEIAGANAKMGRLGELLTSA